MPLLQDFKRLAPHLLTALTRYQQGQMPHSLLIYGPDGVGKKTLARLLCMLLMCQSTAEEKPCGQCDGCVKTMHGSHSNVLYLNASSGASIKIDDMRTVLSALGQHALEEGNRVIVIEDAGRMTPQAQNALLKSLEEPEAGTFFILTAVSPKELLPTIRSRTNKLHIPLWDQASLIAVLEKSGFDQHKAAHLASVSAGSPGLAFQAENDQDVQNVLNMLNQTIFSISTAGDIPQASNQLKDLRDSADMALDLLEGRLTDDLMMQKDTSKQAGIAKMLSAVAEARKYRNANVSWQSIADSLLFHALEDLHSCQ